MIMLTGLLVLVAAGFTSAQDDWWSSSAAPPDYGYLSTSSSSYDAYMPSSSLSLPPSPSPTGISSYEPCAILSQLVTQANEDPNNPSVFVTPSAALACLRSVPVDITEDTLLIDELLLYLQWQSDLNYLSNPPNGFSGHQIDTLADIKGIQTNLKNGLYNNEYDLQWDLWLAFRLVYDFHLVYTPDILNQFIFQRGGPDELMLISLSADGQQLPQLYNYWELLGSDPSKLSPITHINGEDANDYLAYWSNFSTYNDLDARYNRMFFNQLGNTVNNSCAEFTFGLIIDEMYSDNTTIAYANGTVITFPNYVRPLNSDITQAFINGISDGSSLYTTLLNLPYGFPATFQEQIQQLQSTASNTPSPRNLPYRRLSTGSTLPNIRSRMLSTSPRESASNALVTRQNSGPSLPGYPSPIVVTSDSILSGYYLAGTGYDDIAVLSLESFEPTSTAIEFQNAVTSFLQGANAAGKKKLIIDLRGNGGGRIFLGYDLFKQLFPQLTPWGASRFKANDAVNVVGEAVTVKLSGFTEAEAIGDFRNATYGNNIWPIWSGLFNYELNLDANGDHFQSWSAMFGPHLFNGDNVTSLERYDLNNILADDADFTVTGYSDRANAMPQQLFTASNIVTLHDGGCGSTCAVFMEMAKAQGGVQSVAVGGRPQTGAMQSVAGSKGAQVWQFKDIWIQAQTAWNFLPAHQAALNDSMIGQLINALRPLRRSLWNVETGDCFSSVNLRDNIRKDDAAQIPLEFVYEAADRRLFYTWDMIGDPTILWKATADATWSQNKNTVHKSANDPSSLSGGFKPVGYAPYSASTSFSTISAVTAISVPRALHILAAVTFGLVWTFA